MVKLIDLILFYDVGVSTAEADPGEFNVTADLNTNLFEIALLANDLPTDWFYHFRIEMEIAIIRKEQGKEYNQH